MGVSRFVQLFESLDPPSETHAEGTTYSAAPLPSTPSIRVGKNEAGNAAFLVVTQPDSPMRPPITLQHLTIQHRVRCSLIRPSAGPEVGDFTIIQLDDATFELTSYFLDVVGELLTSLGRDARQTSVSLAVEGVAELFQAAGHPGVKPSRGLWAELFLISRSADPSTLVTAWHAAPGEVWDFASGRERLEVKCTAGFRREHHFSYEQLRQPIEVEIAVCSMFVRPSSAGPTIGRLISDIRVQLPSAEAVMHLDRTVFRTLGSGLSEAIGDSFDSAVALESRAFYTAETIPCVNGPLPVGVSGVHFVSDLTEIAQAAYDKEREGLLGAVMTGAP